MENRLKELVEKGLNNIKIAEELGVHRTTVGKYLTKYGIERHKMKHTNCSICDKDLGDNPHNRSNCKTCTTRIRRYRLKVKSVEYKGGCCENCGYNKDLSALEFHHLDPNEKDFGIGAKGYTMSWDEVTKELDKCILVCSNCHHEIHSKYDDERLIKYIKSMGT